MTKVDGRPVRGPELLFCANCQVSVAATELDEGGARRTPKGRVFCAACVVATPRERAVRRRALENEFADDAPIRGAAAVPVATPVGRPSAASELAALRRAVAGAHARIARLEARLAELEARASGAAAPPQH